MEREVAEQKTKEPKVGDPVVYTVGNDRYPAKIVAISDATKIDVRIKVLDGPAAGSEIDAPWGIVERYPGVVWEVLGDGL